MTARPRIAVHAIGAGTPEAAAHVRAESGTAARAPQALVDVPALLLGTAVISRRAFALVRARQVDAQCTPPAGALVLAFVNIDTL